MICIYCSRPIKAKNVVWIDDEKGSGVRFAYGSNCTKRLGIKPAPPQQKGGSE